MNRNSAFKKRTTCNLIQYCMLNDFYRGKGECEMTPDSCHNRWHVWGFAHFCVEPKSLKIVVTLKSQSFLTTHCTCAFVHWLVTGLNSPKKSLNSSVSRFSKWLFWENCLLHFFLYSWKQYIKSILCLNRKYNKQLLLIVETAKLRQISWLLKFQTSYLRMKSLVNKVKKLN